MACSGDALPDQWWRDNLLVQAEVEAHGSAAAAGRAHGVSASTIKTAWAALGLPPLPRSVAKLAPVRSESDDWLLAALKKLGDDASVEQIADHCRTYPAAVRDAAARLGHAGFRVAEEESRVVLRRVPPPSDNVHKALFKGDTVRFGVVSDTHIGSKHERLEELHLAYQVFKDEGITTVYHPGDLVCGYGIFPGQQNEVHKHTYADQVDYAVDNYPRVDGIKTFIISGNHDIEGAWGKAGANPVVAFCNQRPDVTFLGDYRATVELEQGTRIYLLHPKGGIGYAADYKVRKLAEGFEGGQKPNVMLIGHYHRRFDVEARGIHCLLSGCFESGGSFGVRLGLSDPAVGFHICEMTVADDGSVVKWRPAWYRFWAGRTVDGATTLRAA